MLFTVCLGNATNNFSSQTPPRHTDIISTPCTITVPTTGYRIQMYMQVLLIFFLGGGWIKKYCIELDKKNIASIKFLPSSFEKHPMMLR